MSILDDMSSILLAHSMNESKNGGVCNERNIEWKIFNKGGNF